MKFVSWASSKAYENLVANDTKNPSTGGPTNIPAGKRASTYSNPTYLKVAAGFAEADAELRSRTRRPPIPGVQKRPYSGIQFVGIPSFTDFGTNCAKVISSAIAGSQSTDSALNSCQSLAQAAGEQKPKAQVEPRRGSASRRAGCRPRDPSRGRPRYRIRSDSRPVRAEPRDGGAVDDDATRRPGGGMTAVVEEQVLTSDATNERARNVRGSKWGRQSWVRRAPLLPALVFMIIVTQLPFVATLVMSFLNWSAQPDAPGKSFAGLANYKAVFTTDAYRSAVFTSIQMTVTVVLVSLRSGWASRCCWTASSSAGRSCAR